MGDLFFILCEGNGWETIRMNYMGDWRLEYVFFPIDWKSCGGEEAFRAALFSGQPD
jgi:hypothetical protein